MKDIKVFIGIQARSDSKRLPGKVHMTVGGMTLIDNVLNSCRRAANYIDRFYDKFHAKCSIALLVPKGDEIVRRYGTQVKVYEGDHDDVLSRYVQAAEAENADFIVRITADCVDIEQHCISRHIKAALIQNRDYTSNVHYRTYPEGYDTEVLSRRLLQWLGDNAKEPGDREHVTSMIAVGKPFPFLEKGRPSKCHVLQNKDYSAVKTSIDTQEELDVANHWRREIEEKLMRAKRDGVVT